MYIWPGGAVGAPSCLREVRDCRLDPGAGIKSDENYQMGDLSPALPRYPSVRLSVMFRPLVISVRPSISLSVISVRSAFLSIIPRPSSHPPHPSVPPNVLRTPQIKE